MPPTYPIEASAPANSVVPADAPSWWRRWITAPMLFTLGCMLAVYWGWVVVPLERYLTPERGTGYLLGILGGSLMLLLLLYPARKRARWLAWLGSVKIWFQIHMVLGVLGPILVLYHANFRFGATNSNVALICMLLVSGSGLIGRYFHSKVHASLNGHELTLTELQARAERLRQTRATLPLMAGLLQRLDQEERRLMAGSHAWVLVRPLHIGWQSMAARWRLRRFVHEALRQVQPDARGRIARLARGYIDTRLSTTRRVCEYQAYVRLFSWWHILHLPLFILMLLAGIAHVVAVHVY